MILKKTIKLSSNSAFGNSTQIERNEKDLHIFGNKKRRNKHAFSIHFEDINFISEAGFKLMVCKMRFGIHFDNFIFVKFMYQFLIAKFTFL